MDTEEKNVKKCSRSLPKKGLLPLGVLLGLMVIGCVGWIVVENDVSFQLKKTTFEYGEDVDFQKIQDNENIKILKTNYNPKELGVQSVEMVVQGRFGTNSVLKTVKVVDSKKPELKFYKKLLEVTLGETVDLNKNIKVCKDAVDGKLKPTFDETINFKKAGTYPVKVSAKDKSGNTVDDTFSVKIVKKEEKKKTKKSDKKTVNQKGSNHGQKVNNKKSENPQTSAKNQQNNATVQHEKPSVQYSTFGVNEGNIVGLIPKYSSYYTVLNGLRNGQTEFHLSSRDEWNSVFAMIDCDYLGFSEPVGQVVLSEPNGVEVLIAESDVPVYQQAFITADANWAQYRSTIVNALYSMNRTTSTENMVEQIYSYIINNYSYQKNNIPLYEFTKQRVGKCWHYSLLFKDMCNAVGIPCEYIESADGTHAWNHVTVNGVRYKFDLSSDDEYGTRNKKWIRI